LNQSRGFKVAVCGKGGVGKTLIAGTMARLLARRGFKVLAIDVDSNPNLYRVLGIALGTPLKPLIDDEELVEERTGARPGSLGAFFSLTPKVDDIPDRFSLVSPEGVKLLVIGMPKAGLGCMCPQNSLIRALVDHIVLARDEVVILDMEAGLEHFGRGTAKSVDYLLVVMEPTASSLENAARSVALAKELGISRVWCLLNKVRNQEEVEYVRERSRSLGLHIRVVIPYDSYVTTAELRGVPVLDYSNNSPFVLAVDELCKNLLSDWYGISVVEDLQKSPSSTGGSVAYP
jgi:CO dehydrogenase maturation factor